MQLPKVLPGSTNESLLQRRLALAATLLVLLPSTASAQMKHSRPTVLDSDIAYRRDPATGELRIISRSAENPASSSGQPMPVTPHAIQVQSQIVRVTCSVFASDGTPVRGLTRDRFRVYDDGVQRPISNFDDSAEPAGVALIVDASPSVLPDAAGMKDAANALIEGLAPADEVAVVDFSAHTYVQQDFTSVRELLRRAVDRINVRDLLGDTGGSNIYQSVYLVASKLFASRTGRKAIVLLTDGQDSGLRLSLSPESTQPSSPSDNRLTFDDLERLLAAEDIQVFAVSTENRPKILTTSWLTAHRDQSLVTEADRKEGIPAYTLFLAEIARSSGGELYFLHEASTLADTFRRIAQRIGVEYTLGFIPGDTADGAPHSGWHSLRIEVPDLPGISVLHRGSYYIPVSR
jgi:Ca-activated chloride channel homolog